MSSSDEPRWGSVPGAAAEWGEPLSTVRRWAAQGLIPARKIGRNWQVDLNALDRAQDRPARWLTEQDRRLAREVAAALLPLADWRREKLSLLLNPRAGPSWRRLTGSTPTGQLRARLWKTSAPWRAIWQTRRDDQSAARPTSCWPGCATAPRGCHARFPGTAASLQTSSRSQDSTASVDRGGDSDRAPREVTP